MAGVQQNISGQLQSSKDHRRISPTPHFNYETYYKHHEKEPNHSNSLLQYLSDTELKYRNDNLYETEIYRLPRRTDILNRYITMNPNFDHLNRVYEPNQTTIEKQRYRRCIEQQQQKLHRIQKKFDFQTSDGHSSHYFLTGARYNRFDTVDSKILLKYGTFINRNNPEQVDIKASHFKKFREILQAQQRSSSGPPMDSARRDMHDYNPITDKDHQEDLDDLTNRYERNSSRQSNLKALSNTSRPRLPKLKDPARYIDAASQMPERRRGRRSLDRAISSSSTHRSNRHRRHSQHQQQSSPAQQSSVSYVANKVSFSLVNESNSPIITMVAANKQIEDDYEQPATDTHRQDNLIQRESIDDDVDEEQHMQTKQNHDNEDDAVNDDDEDDDDQNHIQEDPVVVEQIREQANVIMTNILASVMDQIAIKTDD